MTSRSALRGCGVLTAVLGATTVLAAPKVAEVAAGAGSVPDLRIVRVLGARQVVQGVVLAVYPATVVADGAVAADVLHATSMLPLAFTRWRRPALLSAATAAVTALTTRVARQSSGQ